MQQNFINKSSVIKIIVVVLLVVVVFVGYSRYIDSKFRVVGTSPATGKISTISPWLDIDFNRQITQKGFSISHIPKFVNNYTLGKEMLVLNLNTPLDSGQVYSITFSVTDTVGDKLINKTVSFQPNNIPFSSLPKDQQKTILNDQAAYSRAHNNPILAYLPHNTIDYNLSGSYNNHSQLILYAELFLSEADMSNQNSAIANYKQEVASYIESIGLNPANYNIDYSISSP